MKKILAVHLSCLFILVGIAAPITKIYIRVGQRCDFKNNPCTEYKLSENDTWKTGSPYSIQGFISGKGKQYILRVRQDKNDSTKLTLTRVLSRTTYREAVNEVSTTPILMNIENIEWKLISLQGVTLSTTGKQATLQIAEGKVYGNAGCNRYNGLAKIENSTLSCERVLSTKMYCMDGMETEDAFLKLLQNKPTYRISENKLELSENGTVKAVFTK